MKISRSRSSSTASSSSWYAGVARSPSCSAIGPNEASNRALRRSESMALKRPVETNHARGLTGMPSAGQRSTAAAKASCMASSARSKSPRRRMSVARTRRDSVRKVWSTESRVTRTSRESESRDTSRES